MKKALLALSLAAAFTLPAHAAEWPAVDWPVIEWPDYAPDQFTFELDIDAMLAQAEDEGAKAREKANEAREKAAEAREKARERAQADRERAQADRERAREQAERAREQADRAREQAERAREQANRAREEARTQSEEWAEWARNFSAEFSNSVAYMFTDRTGRSRVVKGQPYSADIVTETRQTLPDGNVISHRNVNKVWRDGEGRTRQETYRSEKLRSIYISDPVAAMTYTLIPGSKIAISVPRVEMPKITVPRVHVDVHREGKTSSSTSTTTTTTREGRNERVIVRTIDSDGVPGVKEEVRVQVVRVGDDANVLVAPTPPVPPVPPVPPTPAIAPLPPTPVIPGVHTMRFESMGHLGKGDTKSLGSKDIDGVKAEGRQTTWTIPAGQIGNQKPILVTSESWYAPDLQVTMYSRYNDPRTGESIYRLVSVKRGEPPSDMFKVPSDYSVKGKGSRDKEREAPKAK